jgi:hypothetical protein
MRAHRPGAIDQPENICADSHHRPPGKHPHVPRHASVGSSADTFNVALQLNNGRLAPDVKRHGLYRDTWNNSESCDGARHSARENGVMERKLSAVILDGRVPHACLLELFTEAGPGTIIRR